MSPLKQKAIKAIKDLPEDATIDEMMEKLHFIAQVEEGIRAADEGRVIPHEDVVKRIAKWRKK